MSTILSLWNKENDAAVKSPGDQDHHDLSKNLLGTNTFDLAQLRDDTPEFDLNGTALNSM
ncbi:hypothetical protein [Bacillus sp. CECT 9360]|uniref:hypothetical protein n=1 Tax=Bacillus sp. CECT 9360 TaxID=2845821 RepID=UPI001E330F4A|nr:hypothetical protein [Bacillus sp. CECT 9360]CAH0344053.1 hypothetical protein BCI9360_00284 [Bacillus sp. CECT 9360]